MKVQEYSPFEEKKIWDTIERFAWIPWVSMKELSEKREQPIMRCGKGVYIEDVDGKKYLDASSGPVAVNYGYGNQKIIDAVKNQLDSLHFLHYRIAFAEVVVALFKRIAELTPGSLNRIHLNITGTDAVEGAMKIARGYFDDPGKNKIISLYGSYHGLSYGALSITGFASFKDLFKHSLPPGAVHVPAPYCYRCSYGLEYPNCDLLCAQMIETTIQSEGPSTIAAFIGEPIMGVAGIITPPKEYWPMVREICDRQGILLIIDEVMAGWGRTGKLFACEHWNVEPDIMTMAKGLSGVYQGISAVAIQDRLFEKFRDQKFYHSHTQSCSPLACAAALAAIGFIEEENLVEKVDEKGHYLREKLEDLRERSPLVGDVRGKGFFQAIELVADRGNKARCSSQIPGFTSILERKFLERGVIIRIGGYNSDTVYFTPPLIIEKGELDRICEVAVEVLEDMVSLL